MGERRVAEDEEAGGERSGDADTELTWFCVLWGGVLVELVDRVLLLLVKLGIARGRGGHEGQTNAGTRWGREEGGTARRESLVQDRERKGSGGSWSVGFNEQFLCRI